MLTSDIDDDGVDDDDNDDGKGHKTKMTKI